MMQKERQKTGPKFKTLLELETVLAEVAKWHRRGHTQVEIGLKCGISQAQVSRYIDLLKRRYREQQKGQHTEMVEEKVAQLREVRAEAWAAWERSKEDSTKVTVERSASRECPACQGEGEKDGAQCRGCKGEGKVVPPGRKVMEKAGRLPGNEYLKTILETYRIECLLRGLTEENVTRLNQQFNQVIMNWGELTGKPTNTPAHAIEAKINAIVDEEVSRQKPALPVGRVNGNGTNGRHTKH